MDHIRPEGRNREKMLRDDMAPKVVLALIEISLSECCSFFGFLQLAAEGCSSYFLRRVER